MSTSGGYHEYIGGYHEYIGGFQYIGGISRCMCGIPRVHQEDIMMHVGGCYEYIRGCLVHRGFQYKLKGIYHLAPTHAS